MVSGESYYFLERHYRLHVVEHKGAGKVVLRNRSTLELTEEFDKPFTFVCYIAWKPKSLTRVWILKTSLLDVRKPGARRFVREGVRLRQIP
jgi:hypothetical protein